MSLDRQGGYVSPTMISLIISIVFLVGTLSFGAWAFMSRQDYKNNSDKKAEAAADERQAKTEADDAVKYAEEAKNPLKAHKSPDEFGGVIVTYPKTWSGYTVLKATSSTMVDNYFHPDVVPDANNKDNAFALRVQVVEQTYDKILKTFESEVENGKVTAAPYAFPKVATVVGTRFDGQIAQNKVGSLIVVPMRNLTLKVWVESSNYMADFNNIILPNLSFSP